MKIELKSEQSNQLRWSTAFSTKEGSEECGDSYLIKEYDDKVLIAAIDGLGHGKKAAEASKKAVELLSLSNDGSLISIMEYCHWGLKKTRGVVMSLALIDSHDQTISWMGVGNVDGVVFLNGNGKAIQKERFILRGGIVGYTLPQLKANITQISKGDLIILVTDGVKSNYMEGLNWEDEPEKLVKIISSNYFKQSDDALVLVAKYVGQAVYEHEC